MQISEIATKADIEEILKAIQDLQSSLTSPQKEQKFLRSADVRKLLNISDGTLQRLRISGILKASKMGATWIYKYDDIIKMLSENNK